MELRRSETAPGIFVTGTNTNIGKTLCCAVLMALMDAAYWKPVQTGPQEDHDAPTIKKLSGCPEEDILASNYIFPDPLSPHEAARLAGGNIDMAKITWPDNSNKFIIAEGAGGILVPLNEKYLVVDLIKKINIPTLIVASSELGTINHTLLTLEALRNRGIEIKGVVLSGPENSANKKAIEYYGKTDVLGHMPFIDNLNQISFKSLLPHLKDLAQNLGPLRKNI